MTRTNHETPEDEFCQPQSEVVSDDGTTPRLRDEGTPTSQWTLGRLLSAGDRRMREGVRGSMLCSRVVRSWCSAARSLVAAVEASRVRR